MLAYICCGIEQKNVDDYFPCNEKKYRLIHIKNWINVYGFV